MSHKLTDLLLRVPDNWFLRKFPFKRKSKKLIKLKSVEALFIANNQLKLFADQFSNGGNYLSSSIHFAA